MTNYRAPQNRAKSAVLDADKGHTQRIAVMTFAALILAAAAFGAMVTQSGAAEEPSEMSEASASEAPASEATGHDLYRRGYYEEAIVEWTKAADENGDAGAAFRLGEEYFDAKVVKRDVATALKYLTLGAEGGDERAQQDLATMYDNGWGVTANIDTAAHWYLEAAKRGSAVSQYNIATMYETGTGVEKDMQKAYMYYLLAIEGGFPHFATTELENVSRVMTAQQIKDATIMAREFVPVDQENNERDS
jgi:uncharacterized protein